MKIENQIQKPMNGKMWEISFDTFVIYCIILSAFWYVVLPVAFICVMNLCCNNREEEEVWPTGMVLVYLSSATTLLVTVVWSVSAIGNSLTTEYWYTGASIGYTWLTLAIVYRLFMYKKKKRTCSIFGQNNCGGCVV